MRFIHQSLRNICQLSSLEWDFRSGLIGVYGPVGSGKSNATLTAPYVALTGRYDRHPEGKNGLLKRGTRDGHIELTIECAGQPIILRVALTRGRKDEVASEITLTLPDSKQIVGATQVYETLQSVYKLDAAVIDEYVLVRQRALNDLIAQTSAERIKALGRLCGTDRAELVYRALGERLTTLTATAQGLALGQDDTANAMAGARKAYQKARAAYQQARAEIPDKAKLAKALAQLADAELRRRGRQAIEELRGKLDESDATWIAARGTYHTHVAEFQQACAAARTQKETALAAQRTLQACREVARYAARRSAARKRMKLAQRQLDELTAPKPPKHAAYETTAQAQKARDKAVVELAQADSLLTLTGKPVCTTCGTPVKTLAASIEAAGTKATELRQKLRDIEKYLQGQQAYNQALSAFNAAQHAAKATLATHSEALQALERRAPKKRKLPELADARTHAHTVVTQYNQQRQRAVDLSRRCRRLEQLARAALATRKQQQAQLTERQQALPPKQPKATLVAARELTQLAQTRRRAAAAVRETYVGAKAVYRAAKDAHARDARTRKLRVQLQQCIDKLSACRTYAHRDGLPSRVHTAALQLLEKRINPLLASLDAPFEVTADPQSARLLAVMQDGETFPTEALSGGQTVSLSIAYRLAVKELFARHFDMLVLDEPTAWLDTRRMDCLIDVMMRLRRRAAKLNQQIIVVTHSERLRRVFDQVLETV